jgi:hypothetical protein
MNSPDPSMADSGISPFLVKDCALVALATGRKARQLLEFRNELRRIEPATIYHHFWGGMLQPGFEEREYNNDFASWVRHGIHDPVLAERLAALAPGAFSDLDALRHEIVDLIDNRIDEAEQLAWFPSSEPFDFVRSQIVVFDTDRRLYQPAELAMLRETLSYGTIFYHFIDARRRTATGTDDFSDWLLAWGEEFRELREELASIDPYFGSLNELREELATLFSDRFGGKAQ